MKEQHLKAIERLKLEKNFLQEQVDKLEAERNSEIKKLAEESFRDSLLETDVIVPYRNLIEFKAPHPEVTYLKDLFEIRLKENWRTEGRKITGIHLSSYSTTATDEWELHRIISMGKVAEVLLTDSFSFVEALNDIYDDFTMRISVMEKARWKVDSEIEEYKRRIEAVDYNVALERLKKGVTFEIVEGRGLPRISLSYNYTSGPLSFLKINEVSKSGKSVDLVCTERFDQGGEDYERNYPSVRMKNVDEFIAGYVKMLTA